RAPRVRGGARARHPAAPDRPDRLPDAALRHRRRRIRAPGRADLRGRGLAVNPRAGLLAVLLLPIAAWGAPPREIARAFAERGIAMPGVAIVVQESGATAPLFTHQPEVAMNPASVMKLVTTFAALDLLGADYRWRTDAYLDGPLSEGRLDGDLVLAGSGDPKITLEQWDAFVASMRDAGLAEITGDLVLDRSLFRLPPHDPAAFDGEPLLPYNVGPDALLVNF